MLLTFDFQDRKWLGSGVPRARMIALHHPATLWHCARVLVSVIVFVRLNCSNSSMLGRVCQVIVLK